MNAFKVKVSDSKITQVKRPYLCGTHVVKKEGRKALIQHGGDCAAACVTRLGGPALLAGVLVLVIEAHC